MLTEIELDVLRDEYKLISSAIRRIEEHGQVCENDHHKTMLRMFWSALMVGREELVEFVEVTK